MKKLLILVMTLGLLLTGCGSAMSGGGGEEMDVNKYLTGSNAEQCEKLVKELVKALNEKNAALAKSLFSEETKKKCPDLDSKLRQMMDALKGTVDKYNGSVYYERLAAFGQEEVDPLERWSFWKIAGDYQLVTKTETYALQISFCSHGEPYAPEENGIYLLQLLTEEEADRAGFPLSDVDDRGIYIGV